MHCWDESPSVRPTAQDLLHYLQNAPTVWASPLEYPIPDDLDEVASPDSISRSEQILATDVLKGGFVALLVAVLCILMLLLN